MKLELEGQICLVSGGSQGMGREVAKELYEEGAYVLITARRENKLQEAKELIEKTGGPGKVEYVSADMSTQEGIDRAVQACKDKFGGPPLRVLANVVQTKWAFSFETTPDEEFVLAHQELVMSVVKLVRAVLPGMKEAKFGRFLNFGTVAIKEPHRWHYLYGNNYRIMAHALIRNWANEFADQGITFNTISPGLIDTGLSDYILQDAAAKGFTRKEEQPVVFSGRPGQPHEISGFTVFMLSKRSSYITGQNLNVEGGWLRTF